MTIGRFPPWPGAWLAGPLKKRQLDSPIIVVLALAEVQPARQATGTASVKAATSLPEAIRYRTPAGVAQVELSEGRTVDQDDTTGPHRCTTVVVRLSIYLYLPLCVANALVWIPAGCGRGDRRRRRQRRFGLPGGNGRCLASAVCRFLASARGAQVSHHAFVDRNIHLFFVLD